MTELRNLDIGSYCIINDTLFKVVHGPDKYGHIFLEENGSGMPHHYKSTQLAEPVDANFAIVLDETHPEEETDVVDDQWIDTSKIDSETGESVEDDIIVPVDVDNYDTGVDGESEADESNDD